MKMKKTTNPILVSGDAQVSSPCGSHCGDRERPISQLLHPPDRDGKDVEDDAIRVLTGVTATYGKNTADGFSCQFCGKSFKRECGHARHLTLCAQRPRPDAHPGTFCSLCQQSFDCPSGLIEHQKSCSIRQITTADKESPKLICPKCARHFKSAGGLGRHVKSCSGIPQLSETPVTADNRDQSPDTEHSELEMVEANWTHVPESSEQSSKANKTQQSAVSATNPRTPHSVSDCTEDLIHGPAIDTGNIPAFQTCERLVLPSAGSKRFWSNADQALDAVLRQECPNFDHLSPVVALHELERAICFFFSSPDVSSSSPKKQKEKPKKSSSLKKLRVKFHLGQSRTNPLL